MSGSLRLGIVLLSIIWAQWLARVIAVTPRNAVEMKLVYKYAKELKRTRGGLDWRSSSLDRHERLMKRDRLRHAARRRGLLASSLAPSNETANLDALGGLHYTFLNIGTPSKTFVVALDTGSDLLWVPCNCEQCSTTNWAAYGLGNQDQEFAVYEESTSSTSGELACSSSLCSSSLTSSSSSSCQGGSQKCSYVINYMSSGTSTSGYIVQDVLYLNYEATSGGGNTSTPIYFGCGQVQTGDLLQGVAPNGLFGLGPEAISVPSTLARNGVIPTNSFSMCFSASDSSGRLVFGVEAIQGLPTTPLVPITPSVYYVIATTQYVVNGEVTGASENLIFDTGTSYTALPQSTSQRIGDIMNKHINLPQFQLNGTFDYCWNTSNNGDLNALPSLAITFAGGSTWNIDNPYVTFANNRGSVLFFCLGITPLRSGNMGIIGHNFMGGYEFFFNQHAMAFSWSPSTCYNLNASTVASPLEEPSFVNRATTPSSSATFNKESLAKKAASFLILMCSLFSFIFFL